ncbi:1597_t:CDS:2 [Diversispora eburnea]|uniref:1597_t:CDS:1 n=1 Tax=Diversispora eburnea TaxID=1213867 RepID=A0A9N8YPM8_9GLOM|nr:1597_t:CDS:2 [Diversispora eburnea]
MNLNNFNTINQSPNPVTKINDILNYVNNLQDLELILNPPYQLTLSLDSLLLPARINHRNRKNKINKIPRPQNAWILFRKDYEANKRIKFPDQLFKMKTISINAGDEWKIQSSQVKRYFEILSKLALEKHKIIYPDYKYTPKRRSNSNKDLVFHKTLVLGEDNQINKINQDDDYYEFSTTNTSSITSQNTFTEFNNEFFEVDTSHQPEHYNNSNEFNNSYNLVLGEDNQINKINQDDNYYEFSTTTTSPIASQNFTELNNEFSEIDTSHQPEHYNGRNDHHLFMPHTSRRRQSNQQR